MLAEATPDKRSAVERFLAGDALLEPHDSPLPATGLPQSTGPATALEVAANQDVPEAWDIKAVLGEILRQVRAVAQGTYDLRAENGQLRDENERLRAMQSQGLFNFVLHVEREDFLAFAVIMALGNANAASKFLNAPQRTFYDRLERWRTGSKSCQQMLRWVQWRKAVGRKIKLQLPDPSGSGSSDDTAANPRVLREVVAAIEESSSRDYPSVLRQVLEVLLAQNPNNWESARRELVELIKDELAQ